MMEWMTALTVRVKGLSHRAICFNKSSGFLEQKVFFKQACSCPRSLNFMVRHWSKNCSVYRVRGIQPALFIFDRGAENITAVVSYKNVN